MIRRPPRSTLFPYTTLSMVAVSLDRKSTRLNSSHTLISYAVFCLKKNHRRRAEREDDRRGAHVEELPQRGDDPRRIRVFYFFLNDPAPPEISTLPLHDALPISLGHLRPGRADPQQHAPAGDLVERGRGRSEEHTSELPSHSPLVGLLRPDD